jgi:hypothetical protein
MIHQTTKQLKRQLPSFNGGKGLNMADLLIEVGVIMHSLLAGFWDDAP